MGSVTSMIYLFSTLAPFLSINHLRLSPKVFGLMNCIPPLGLIGGSFVSHWLSTRRAPLFSHWDRNKNYDGLHSRNARSLLFGIHLDMDAFPSYPLPLFWHLINP